ncbi:MAG: sulfatase-like hydrolase/transferase [Bryobacterales bacterium]|nr:sulfatase-like hydrolase/transferase [Bryobacterales bacterium]
MRRRDLLTLPAAAATLAAQTPERPNILWITCEDTGPELGCYGDRYAVTPYLDAFAGRALRYLHAWSNAPVCAPARTTIISGLYPPSTGSEHMRSMTRLPESMKMFPCYLREAGYYCTNNSKEDYNLAHTGKVWDASSPKAHYSQRAAGQPFFAVFNNTITHESQIRTRPHKQVSDPAEARVPAYHPDTPEVRQDWAQYYDNIRTMDTWAGKHLKDLEEAGLAESTIVFFYGDHGSGMPRSKRWPYNSGLQVPLLVYIPEKFKHLRPPEYKTGGTSDRLVSFVDLAPTVLSLAGVPPQAFHQGFAFAGTRTAPPQPYVYGFRGRMDERVDLVRSVRDKQYVYLRQYMPHRIYGQHINYMFETPTTRVWKKRFDEGQATPAQQAFWKTKPVEELYDLTADRDEVKNLAGSPQHKTVLERLRKAQRALAERVRDVGFLPEGEIHARAGQDGAPYAMGHDPARYAAARVMDAADLASRGGRPSLTDADSAVRYWAAQGYLVRQEADAALRRAVESDASPYVRAVAAEALGRYGQQPGDVDLAVKTLIELAPADKHGVFVSILALNGLDALDVKAAGVKNAVAALPKEAPGAPERFRSYIPRLIEKTLADLP